MKQFPIRYFLCLLLLPASLTYGEPSLPVGGETPASLSCVYGLTKYIPGCPISTTTNVPQGGSGIIAVIEGGHDPDGLNELTQFSNQTGLPPLPSCDTSPAPCFQTYYASNCTTSGTVPPLVGISEPEIDIEWAHAMAPNASIYMVEADCPSTTPCYGDIDAMMKAVRCANRLLTEQNGGGFISFSDSFAETSLGPNELNYDGNFKEPGVKYVMSSGDYYAPARYPATSPYVIAAGGTQISRDNAGNYQGQAAWKNTEIPCTPGEPCRKGVTGGPSLYEPRPAYQNSVQKIVGTKRGTPDISFVAQSVSVFCCSYVGDTTNAQCCNVSGNPENPTLRACESVTQCSSGLGKWQKTGGTSLAAPALAGIINSANSGARSVAEELTLIYNDAIKNYNANWTDIIEGNNGYSALKGYDFTTGLGVPRGYKGK